MSEKKVKSKKYDRNKFYQLDNIFKIAPNALYYIIWGERSNGKTHAVLEYGIDQYISGKGAIGIIRRLEENFKGQYGKDMFSGFIFNKVRGNIIEQKTNGKYNDIRFYSRRWYFIKRDEAGEIVEQDPNPFCYAFAISSQEKYKGLQYPSIVTILNDEFILPSNNYLVNEFDGFISVISSIVRADDDAKIFLCGNSLPTYNPYIANMGIKHFKTQKPGTIDIYRYTDEKLIVAVEHTDTGVKNGGKKSDSYFAFDNPKLKMVTTGEMAFNVYPRLPFRYENKDIKYIYFICFDDEVYQCEIIQREGVWITYVHRKTTPIKEGEKRLIYTMEVRPEKNYSRRLMHPVTPLQKTIAMFYAKEKVFYQDNAVGEAINQYIQWQDKL